MELYSLYLPRKVQISLLYNLLIQVLKPVLECKQVDNNNFIIFLQDQTFSQKKKHFFFNSVD